MAADASRTRLSGPVVVDASVVVEYLVALTLTEQASRLLQLVLEEQIELWAPDLLYAEAVSALRKLVRLGAVTARAGGRAVEQLARLPITATGTAGLMAEAWSMRSFLTPYDACYVALAARLGGALVTADAKLARALRRRRRCAVLLLGELSEARGGCAGQGAAAQMRSTTATKSATSGASPVRSTSGCTTPG